MRDKWFIEADLAAGWPQPRSGLGSDTSLLGAGPPAQPTLPAFLPHSILFPRLHPRYSTAQRPLIPWRSQWAKGCARLRKTTSQFMLDPEQIGKSSPQGAPTCSLAADTCHGVLSEPGIAQWLLFSVLPWRGTEGDSRPKTLSGARRGEGEAGGWGQASFKSHPSVPGAALLRPWTPGQGRAEGPGFLPLRHWGTFLSTQGPWGFWQKRGTEPRCT